MRLHKKLSLLGRNKKQEIKRLLYEIGKRENVSPEIILKDYDVRDFARLKKELLKRRFPSAYPDGETDGAYLPKLKIDKSLSADIGTQEFYPKKIFAEKKVSSSSLARRLRNAFPEANFNQIPSLKEYLKQKKSYDIKNYNKRRETVFITYENYDFFKKCPCTQGAVRCGYHIFNLSFGCMFECSYCYLQEYVNSPGLIFPSNLDGFFDSFSSYKKPGMRIGTGEFSDSLMLDRITEYSPPIIDFFKKHPDVSFEFKTKSADIDGLLKTSHAGNIVVSWSLNPRKIINENEFLTVSLKERLRRAKKCSDAGYKLGFHFDPVIYFKGWQREYKKVIDLLFAAVKPEDVAWISVGTLRFNPGVKQVIETRFPDNKILDGELLKGFDGKLRYPTRIRKDIYNFMLDNLFAYSGKLKVYLCMEDRHFWKGLNSRPALPAR